MGIPIHLHITFAIAFPLIAWILATSFMPSYFAELSELDYWIMGILGAGILFGSVLIHELAHSILAARYGLYVRRIVLFIFGGVADMANEARDVRHELRIAAIGPVTSFVIAGAFALGWWLVGLSAGFAPLFISNAWQIDAEPLATNPVLEGLLFYGAVANAMIGAFNLLPAFPLDGGRILRALMCMHGKSYEAATETAARTGIAMSYAFMGLGFLLLVLSKDFVGSIWLVLIGFFIHISASAYLTRLPAYSTCLKS